MGWSDCGEDDEGRPIGYGVDAVCDYPGCDAQIDRGLAYACGSMHGGGQFGCGRYFCGRHLYAGSPEALCGDCVDRLETRQEAKP